MRDTDAIESRAPKRHRPLEPPAAPGIHRREPNPPPSSRRRAGRPPPLSKVRRRPRSLPYVSATQRLAELQRAKRPSEDAAVDGRERGEGETASPSSLDAPFVENEERPSHSHCNCKHPEASSAAVDKRSDPAIRGDEQEWHSEKMDGKNHTIGGWKKGNSFIKPRMKRRFCYNCREPGHLAGDCPYENRDDQPNCVKKDAMRKLLPNPLNKKKNLKGRDGKAFIGATYMSGDQEGDEKEGIVVGVVNLAMARPGSIFKYGHKASSGSARGKKMKRQRWAEAKKEMREMKKDNLLEKIKKLQACVWLLEKDGADMAQIMEFRSLLESTKKQYVENEAQFAQQVSSASQQVQNRDRHENMDTITISSCLEKKHRKDSAQSLQKVPLENRIDQPEETMASPIEKVEGDEQNMGSKKVEGRSMKGFKAVSEQNEFAEEVNRLKSELEAVRRDRDYQSAHAQSLMADVAKQKEIVRRYAVELEDAMRRVAALEEGGLLQLASANEKPVVPSS